MKALIIIWAIALLWVIFEAWRAPWVDEETGKIIRPYKKISDLFKLKNKKSGSYSDLEKYGRGRSKH